MEDLSGEVAAEEPPSGAIDGGVDVMLIRAGESVGGGGALGRSAKTTPCWIKAWWARELAEMKMEGREPIWRVTMGPYLAWRVRRIGSSSEKDLRSQSRLPTTGTVLGPGGRFSFGKKKS